MTEGTISLARLFLSSGADAAISSTLKVDNNASAELFKYFYQFLYNGNTVSESLFKAKKELRKRTPEFNNPYFWSSYQLLGKDLIFTH
jgi:CHAT domain-containing protein